MFNFLCLAKSLVVFLTFFAQSFFNDIKFDAEQHDASATNRKCTRHWRLNDQVP